MNQVAFDFDPVLASVREVDRFHDSDRYVVFETDGKVITEVANPEPSACSLEKLRETLLACGAHGKICVAVYKFNYPRDPGSSTLKEKSVLILAQDPAQLLKSLGSSFKVMQVTMPTINFVWKPLQNALSKNHFSAAATLELGDDDMIKSFDGEEAWSQISRSQTRIGAGEKESFVAHAEEQEATARGAGGVQAPVEQVETAATSPADTSASSGSSAVKPQPAAATATVAVDTKKLAKEVEELVSAKVEEVARKAAQDEVGRAIRKMGSDVGRSIGDVGKVWMDKASGAR